MSDWGITTQYPPGPETPLEMLDRADAFFALTLAGGVTFIPKTQVVVVSCRNQATLADPDRVSAALKAKRYDVSFLGEG